MLKKDMVVEFVYDDLIKNNKMFFMPCLASWTYNGTRHIKNYDFIYKCCFGLVPRWFDCNNEKDKMIYTEEQEVQEIIFIQ